MNNKPLTEHASETEAGKDTVLLVYVLQLLGLFTALTGIAGVIVNYMKWDDVRGTWLESHFRWQVRTFWFTVLWGLVGSILILVGIGVLILGVLTLWYLYRVIRGWIYLNDRRAVYPIKDGN